MTLSFRTDRSGRTVQTQIRLLLEEVWSGSSLFAIPFAPFRQNNQRFSLFVWILGSLQQKYLVSENLGTLRYVESLLDTHQLSHRKSEIIPSHFASVFSCLACNIGMKWGKYSFGLESGPKYYF